MSSLAGLFGAKVIVATHTPQAYALFTTETTINVNQSASSSSSPSPSSSSSAAATPSLPPSSSSSTLTLNPLAHILRVVDCSSPGFSSDPAVLAAVMEETGGLGVEAVVDLQVLKEEWNFLQMKHVTIAKEQTTQQTQQPVALEGDKPDGLSASNTAAAPSSSSPSSSNPLDSNFLPTPFASLAPHSLPPLNPISFPTLVQCLAVQGRLLTSTPNLQVDPPLSRQLFLRGGSLSYLFSQNWLLGATQRGRFAHVVTEVLNLANRGTLQANIHAKFPLSALNQAWRALTTSCPTGKIVVQMPSSSAAQQQQQHHQQAAARIRD